MIGYGEGGPFLASVNSMDIHVRGVGGTDPERIAESERTGVPVPSNHSTTFAPIPEPTLKACVSSMTAAVLELMGSSAP